MSPFTTTSNSMIISPAPSPSPPPDASISRTAALSYWSSIPPSNTGMLGGFPQISPIDLQSSANFLAKLKRKRAHSSSPPAHSPAEHRLLPRAVDCGAGIGRITLGLLSTTASTTDIVEPVQKFTNEITRGAEFASLRAAGKIGEIYNLGLEAWTPTRCYDLFWNQWCLGQLTDAQLVAYLVKCKGQLAERGWIVVKENISSDADGRDVFDKTDSSVTRTDEKFRRLFKEAGLTVVMTEMQRGLPRGLGLYPIRMYALQPVVVR